MVYKKMALKAKSQTGNMIKMTIRTNADKAARNLSGTNKKASCWGNPKSGPPKISLFVKIRNKFGSTRPTTILTKEIWPNPARGPSSDLALSIGTPDSLRALSRTKGGFAKLTNTAFFEYDLRKV